MKPETLARIILFTLLAAAGFVGFLAIGPAFGLRPPPASAADVELHARMPENGGWSETTLYAEVGRPLKLRLTSDDVLHSFALGKSSQAPVDLHPGEWTETTLVFDRPGRYTYYCTRWCGRNHWRMRGTIIVQDTPDQGSTGAAPAAQPRYLRLGLDLDAPHQAGDYPAAPPSSERGAAIARLPDWALDRQTVLENSPEGMWQRLQTQRLQGDPSLKDRSDAELWDAVAYLWSRQTTPQKLADAQQLFATNCAACHGETGKGDGVMVAGLPRYVPGQAHSSSSAGAPEESMAGMDGSSEGVMRLSAPPDFTDPRNLTGASPALLEGKMLRGGMGTGMPYWGPIFTEDQMDALIAYLYTFIMKK